MRRDTPDLDDAELGFRAVYLTPNEHTYLRDLLNGEIGIRPGRGLTGEGVLELKKKFADGEKRND